jgi:hypothetical protein
VPWLLVFGFWFRFPTLSLWGCCLHWFDYDGAPIDDFQQVAGGGDGFCLVIAGGIALGCDQEDFVLVPIVSIHDPQALDAVVAGGVEGAGQAKNGRQSGYALPLSKR